VKLRDKAFIVQQLKMSAQWSLVDCSLELVLGYLLLSCPFTFLRLWYVEMAFLCLKKHLLLSFIINERLHQMNFLHLTDLTNWNPWNTWFCQSTFYLHWNSCSFGSWIAFSKKSCLVSSPSPGPFVLLRHSISCFEKQLWTSKRRTMETISNFFNPCY
jgi:hypothetical protein